MRTWAFLMCALSGLSLASSCLGSSSSSGNATPFATYCQVSCKKLQACDSGIDIQTCISTCQNLNAAIAPKLRNDFMTGMTVCVSMKDCATVLGGQTTEVCARESALSLAPTPAGTTFCDDYETTMQRCEMSFEAVSCRQRVRQFKDATIAAASACLATDCASISDCLGSTFGEIVDVRGGPIGGGSGGLDGSGGLAPMTGGFGGSTGGTTPGAGGIGGSGGTGGNASSVLGKECTGDADCPGMKCIAADSDSLTMGGPAGGLCTVDCTEGEADSASCSAMNGVCFFNICFEKCAVGATPAGKCHERKNMACVELAAGGGVCLPQCNVNSDCPPSRVCDIGAAIIGWPGVCRDQSLGGLPTGAQCDASLPYENDPCNGWCAPLSDTDPTAGMCANGCTYGPPPGCGWDGSGVADAACIYALDTDNVGDAALCAELCDCDDDCLHPNAVCSAFGATSSLGAFYQRAGYCTVVAGSVGIPCR